MATIVEGNPKAPFSIATTPRCRGGRYSFPGLLYFTFDPYLIMLNVKQGGIKYHFLSLWYDSTWDWTQVSRAIAKHNSVLGEETLVDKHNSQTFPVVGYQIREGGFGLLLFADPLQICKVCRVLLGSLNLQLPSQIL